MIRNVMITIGLALEITMRMTMLIIGVSLRKEITWKFRFEEPKFYSYPEPHAFSNWIADVECYLTIMKCLNQVRFDLLN